MSTKDQQEDNRLTGLRQKAAALLEPNEIYLALAYGWENEDTPADGYLKLAMWTSDASFEPRSGVWDQTSPPEKRSPRDETFYKAGENSLELWSNGGRLN